MVTFKQFIHERISKNRWEHLLSADKHEYADDLIRVVDTAYKHTSLGSFVKSVHDVQSSDWHVLDYDSKPDVDVAIFFRLPRPNEVWAGRKIQGIGHDGKIESKDKLLKQLTTLLSSGDWWIEASDALARSLLTAGLKPNEDRDILSAVFPSITEFHDGGSYTRTAGNTPVKEYVFGNLELK